MPSNHLILCRPLLLLLSVFPSIRIFSNQLAVCIGWPKYWSFSFSIHPSNAYSGLISFRTDWFDLLAFQGILKSLLQHHSPKAAILRRSAIFIVQLSHYYHILVWKSFLCTCTEGLSLTGGCVITIIVRAFFHHSKFLFPLWHQMLVFNPFYCYQLPSMNFQPHKSNLSPYSKCFHSVQNGHNKIESGKVMYLITWNSINM